ncbi:uncharacterized protein V6R79_010178 [Siganus canaliculatus]
MVPPFGNVDDMLASETDPVMLPPRCISVILEESSKRQSSKDMTSHEANLLLNLSLGFVTSLSQHPLRTRVDRSCDLV